MEKVEFVYLTVVIEKSKNRNSLVRKLEKDGFKKKISNVYERICKDNDSALSHIEYLKKWEGVYYICKSYFEIFWGFKFKPIEKVNNILETDSEEQDKK